MKLETNYVCKCVYVIILSTLKGEPVIIIMIMMMIIIMITVIIIHFVRP